MNDLTIKQSPNTKFHLYTIPQSDTINAKVLAAGVAEVETVPAEAKCVLFSSEGNFYAKHNAAASVPAGDVIDGTASELNPSGYIVAAADTIGLIASTDCVITLAYYK